MKEFYAYLWLRENGTPYYAGKGYGDRAFRSSKHSVRCPKDRVRIVIIHCRNEQEAFETEKNLIRNWGRKDIGTGILRNFTDGGEGPSGQIISQARREKQAAKLRGRPTGRKGIKLSPEWCANIKKSKSFISEETRKKCGDAHRGKKLPPCTEERKQKISVALTGHPALSRPGPLNPFFGKTHSSETRAKISAAKLGIPIGPKPPEHGPKVRLARIEYWKKLRAAGLDRDVWTSERDAEVATLHIEGLSQRQIAKKFSANRQSVRESLRRTRSMQ
jgi:hypothetical protein